jgi:hypothetical protein
MARKYARRKPDFEETIGLLRRRFGGRLAPPLEGLAYRFKIWLPVLAQGKTVFSGAHRDLLRAFFHSCFGGFSQSNLEAAPPWSGSWLPDGAAAPIVDHHIHLIVYSLQDAEALTCMRQLKWTLQQDQQAAQQVVLIEKVPVHLIEAEEVTR